MATNDWYINTSDSTGPVSPTGPYYTIRPGAITPIPSTTISTPSTMVELEYGELWQLQIALNRLGIELIDIIEVLEEM